MRYSAGSTPSSSTNSGLSTFMKVPFMPRLRLSTTGALQLSQSVDYDAAVTPTRSATLLAITTPSDEPSSVIMCFTDSTSE